MIKRTLIFTALCSVLSPVGSVHAQQKPKSSHSHQHEKELATVTVTASPLGDKNELTQPVALMIGAELEQQLRATIGETVSQQAGVQSSYFGPAVGRPIVRGLEGARVQVLSGGMSAMDASTVSADHSVSIEPFLADQIEVLKGPSTLLFGNGAIGGVVNVVDGRIPDFAPEGFSGRAEIRGNTGANEKTGLARMDTGSDRYAIHADVFHRDAGDINIPDDQHRLENSALRNGGGALGYTRFADFGSSGIAFSRYESVYGIPGGHAHEDGQAEEEAVRIDMQQNRFDSKTVWNAPFAAAEKIKLQLAHSDYQHLELEGDQIGTRFENKAWESNAEILHTPWKGWEGAIGLQLGNRDFSAMGDEAFLPASTTRDVGLFVVEQLTLEPFTFELGGRADRQSIKTHGPDNARHSTASFSGSVIWNFSDSWDWSFNLDRAQRAPSSEELFAEGAHIAQQNYERGNALLREETAKQIETGLHFHGDIIELKIALYRNQFSDFIYLADTDQIIDELPLRIWNQADATFTGSEAELKWQMHESEIGRFDLRIFADSVRASLDAGGNLPRIAPSRVGANLQFEREAWRASLGAIRSAAQNRVAINETPSDAFTLVNAHLSYSFSSQNSEWEIFADAANLTDELGRSHTSFLKDRVPLPGRSIAFGLRAFF